MSSYCAETHSGVYNDTKIAAKPKSRDKRLLRFWDRLDGFKGEVDVMVWEAARVARHPAALIVISEYQAIIKLWCLRNEVPYRSYSPSELKKWACGHGRATKEDMMLAASRLSGKEITQDDLADSTCLYYMAKELLI